MVDIREWGPRAWSVLHTFADAWKESPTDDDRRKMHAFLTRFGPVLPCPQCSAHFTNVVWQDIPHANCAALTSRTHLQQWLVKVHNDVNRRLGKPQFDSNSTEGLGAVAIISIALAATLIVSVVVAITSQTFLARQRSGN